MTTRIMMTKRMVTIVRTMMVTIVDVTTTLTIDQPSLFFGSRCGDDCVPTGTPGTRA
jgi:hypothetical protein